MRRLMLVILLSGCVSAPQLTPEQRHATACAKGKASMTSVNYAIRSKMLSIDDAQKMRLAMHGIYSYCGSEAMTRTPSEAGLLALEGFADQLHVKAEEVRRANQ